MQRAAAMAMAGTERVGALGLASNGIRQVASCARSDARLGPVHESQQMGFATFALGPNSECPPCDRASAAEARRGENAAATGKPARSSIASPRRAIVTTSRGFAASSSGDDRGETKDGKTTSKRAKPKARAGGAKSKAKKDDDNAGAKDAKGAKSSKGAGALSLEELLSEVADGPGARSPFKSKGYALVDLADLVQGKERAGEPPLLPEGLPKGLKLELLSGTRVSCRPEMVSFLRSVLKEESGDSAQAPAKKFFVDGSKGTGKSVLLALLVALARMKGWVVLYLPSASRLVHGGRFKLDDESQLWENPDVAGEILGNLAEAHGPQLEAMGLHHFVASAKASSPASGGPGEASASSGDSAEDATQNLVDLLSALASQDKTPLLICADDYNALFGETRYTDYSDRPLSPHDLKLVCAFRWLERPEVTRGAVVAAPSTTLPVKKTIKIPQVGEVTRQTLRPFTYEEACVVWSKHGQKQPKQRSKEEQILKNFVLGVNGDGHAIRDFSAWL